MLLTKDFDVKTEVDQIQHIIDEFTSAARIKIMPDGSGLPKIMERMKNVGLLSEAEINLYKKEKKIE